MSDTSDMPDAPDASHRPVSHAPVTLSPADAAVLDALLEARSDPALRLVPASPDGAPPADPAREKRVQAWLQFIGSAPVPAPSPALLEHTLAAVRMDRMKIQAAAQSLPPRSHAHENRPRRWKHLQDVAAMLVAAAILVAVLIPAVSQARQSYRRTLCASNMASLGTAIGLYATDFNNQLPSLAASPDHNWLAPSPAGHTNTANLLPLIYAHYIQPKQLICAGRGLPETAAATPVGNDIENCDYSYINLFGPTRPTWDKSARTLILADQNPLFAYPKRVTDADCNSFNHAQKGTYVLHADAHATWETSPDIGPDGDNIWTVSTLASNQANYTGTEVAAGTTDIFLAP